MKKSLSVLALTGLLVLPAIALAQETIPEGPQNLGAIVTLIETIGNWIFTFLLVLAVVMIVWAGFQFVTAGGSPEAVSSARSKVIYALIGVVVALLAKGAIAIVRTTLGL